MVLLINKYIEKVFFILFIVDMEKLIIDMMFLENIMEEELYKKKEIKILFGEILFWEYFIFVRKNFIEWNILIYILYGEKDNMIFYEIILNFINKLKVNLIIMKGGEYWFYIDE